jgi:hypothetical protein
VPDVTPVPPVRHPGCSRGSQDALEHDRLHPDERRVGEHVAAAAAPERHRLLVDDAAGAAGQQAEPVAQQERLLDVVRW